MGKTNQYAAVDGKLEVTQTEEKVSVATYDYDALLKQRENIIVQKDRDNLQRDEEIAFVDELIQAAKDNNVDNVAVVVTP